MTRAPSYTYLWPATNASFRRTEVGLVREIVSAIGERSLIGQVTFPLQFSRVIPLTRRLFVGPERLAPSHGNSSSPSTFRETTIYTPFDLAVESSTRRVYRVS